MFRPRSFFANVVLQRCLVWVVLLVVSVSGAQAQGTTTGGQPKRFVHVMGKSGRALAPNKEGQIMQQVHEDWHVIYANPGDNLSLTRRWSAFMTYARWYNYATDNTMSGLRVNGGAPVLTDRGNVYCSGLEGGGGGNGVNSVHANYTYNGGVVYIACDQSSYKDANNTSATEFREPTLSQRVVYEIRPALEQALKMEQATGTQWLETHKMIAPTGRTLHIGPNHKFLGGQSAYFTPSSDKKSAYRAGGQGLTSATQVGWHWAEGDKTSLYPGISNYQFMAVQSDKPDTIVYELTYSTDVATYNVARFEVIYMDAQEVGPYTNLTNMSRIKNLDPIAEERFNYTDGATYYDGNNGGTKYYISPLPLDASTYSFYYGTNRQIARPHYAEYALMDNTKNTWACFTANSDKGNKKVGVLYNHSFTSQAIPGYALYADGSDIVGRVFSLDIPGMDLCPGATMYFSAYVGDVSNQKGSYSNPDLDFIVMGLNADGSEEIVTTFTTGEFSSSFTNTGIESMDKNEWLRILFPIELDRQKHYQLFRLVVTNKSVNSDGNDFLIDDIQVFMKPAPITVMEATSQDGCIGKHTSLVLYTKVDYAKIENFEKAELYYRWLDADGQTVIDAPYYNKTLDSQNRPAGYVKMPSTFDGSLGTAFPQQTFENFDKANKYLAADTSQSHIAFIYDTAADAIELDTGINTSRYSLFVATPVPLGTDGRSDYYTCVLSTSLEDLNKGNDCSSARTIEMTSGKSIVSEAYGGIVAGTTVDACGNKAYDLSLVMRYVGLDAEKRGSTNRECHYKAHWLYGDEAHVDARQDLYGASYATICAAVQKLVDTKGQDEYIGSEEEALVERLRKMSLLQLAEDLPSPYTFVTEPLASMQRRAYTAFPAAREEGHEDAPLCLEPQVIVVSVPGTPEDPLYQRHAITFVKAPDEQDVPDFVLSRARRARVLEGTDTQLLYARLSEPENSYSIEHIDLISVDDDAHYIMPSTGTSTGTPIGPHSYPITATVGTSNLLSGEGRLIQFSGLSKLPAGHHYLYKIMYRLRDNKGSLPSCGSSQAADGSEVVFGEMFIEFIVTPRLLTFSPEAVDGSWNDDASFTYTVGKHTAHIAPVAGSSVVIAPGSHRILPATSNDYQEQGAERSVDPNALPYITFDIGYQPYVCRHIHLAAGADLLGQQHLNVNGDWTFDMALTNHAWTLAAMPLQGILTGDLFIPAKGEGPAKLGSDGRFEVTRMNQTPGDSALDRVTYSLYNSFYNAKVYNTEQNVDEPIAIGCSTWSEATNSLTAAILPGTGWALGFSTQAKDLSVLRLPKRDTEYGYFRRDIWVKDMSEKIHRSTHYGKPAFQGDDFTITLENVEDGNYFLLGNPTFACIDVHRFLEHNSQLLTGAYTLSASDSEGARYEAGISSDLEQASTSGTSERVLLLPYHSIFLEARESSKTLQLTITPDMLTTKELGETEAATHVAKRPHAAQDIYIQVQAGTYTSTALLCQSSTASNEVLESEDAELFLLDAAKTPFAIYTVACERPLAINAMASQAIVPLAFYAQQQVGMQTLSFRGDADYLAEWDFVDSRSGVRRPLTEAFSVSLSLDPKGHVRYYLEHTREEAKAPAPSDGLGAAAAPLCSYVRDGQLTLYSAEDMLQLGLYDAAGRCLYSAANAGKLQQFDLSRGVYVVRTATEALKVIIP